MTQVAEVKFFSSTEPEKMVEAIRTFLGEKVHGK